MKKATKVLCGIASVLVIGEIFGTLGEVQALCAISDIEPEATDRALNILTDKNNHKKLDIDLVISAKSRLIGNLAKAIIKHS